MIILISNKWDFSTDYIVRELNKRNENFIRINTEDLINSKSVIDFQNSIYTLTLGNKKVKMENNLKSVLYRRPIKFFKGGKTDYDEPTLRYISDQWYAFIRGLFSINNVLWVNHPLANEFMENKIVQLKKAQEFGFNIPLTCITSDYEQVKDFFKNCGKNIIAKSLKSPIIEYTDKDYFIFTNIIKSLDDIDPNEIRVCPTIFQENLEDKIDYRVTVVGNKIYTAKIEDANGEKIPMDWRTRENNIKFIRSELPPNIKDMCLRYVSQSGLIFGAIDLVYAKNGFYFLEINPNGEWGWLQETSNLPIAESITDYLIKGNTMG